MAKKIQVNRELSRRVVETEAKDPQSVWHTAWEALHTLSDPENGLHVEGWAVMLGSSRVFEHGWVELDGRIVDPTRWNSDLAYFPVLRFARRQLRAASVNCPKLPITWRYSSRQWTHPSYHRAWKNAQAFAEWQRLHARQAV